MCGDGIVIADEEECDDKNTKNNDGCSSHCQQEDSFICTGQPSKCILHTNFVSAKYNYARRVVGENKGILSFSLLPSAKALEEMDWSKLIHFNFSSSAVTALKYTYSSTTGELQVEVSYVKDL